MHCSAADLNHVLALARARHESACSITTGDWDWAGMRRFDLLHVMIDEPDDIMDYRIASHIVAVHQRQDQAFDVPYTMSDIQLYLKYARAHKPELTESVRHPPCPQSGTSSMDAHSVSHAAVYIMHVTSNSCKSSLPPFKDVHPIPVQTSAPAALACEGRWGEEIAGTPFKRITGAMQAKRELVESYKRLRTEDAAPGSSTSYRCLEAS